MRLQSEMRWIAVLQKNKTLEQIADELEESVKDIQPIYDIVKKHAPEYDVDVITTEYWKHGKIKKHKTLKRGEADMKFIRGIYSVQLM